MKASAHRRAARSPAAPPVWLTTWTPPRDGSRTESGGTVAAPFACQSASPAGPAALDRALGELTGPECPEVEDEPPPHPASATRAATARPTVRSPGPAITRSGRPFPGPPAGRRDPP